MTYATPRLRFLSSLVTLMLLIGLGVSLARAGEADFPPPRLSTHDFLDAEGFLDARALEAAGLSALDLGPAPFRAAFAANPGVSSLLSSDDGKWADNFGPPQTGSTNDFVQAIVEYNGELIAAGYFTMVDGVAANRIARFDGTSWQPLGSGLTGGPVFCLAVYNGELYAGGSFTTAGGFPASRIAKWNGASWSAVGAGSTLGGPVYSMVVYNGDLVVGGGFNSIGGVPIAGIARWNGASWATVTPVGANGTVYALGLYNGELIAGGTFTSIGGNACNRIARYNGGIWAPLGSGMDAVSFTPEVYALAVLGTDLIATGSFVTAGGSICNHIARWNGASWSSISGGLGNGGRSLLVVGADLYVGGAFLTAGGNPAAYVARYSGGSWSAMGSGMNARVVALGSYGGSVYAGGWFNQTNGGAAYIARWDGALWVPTSPPDFSAMGLDDIVYAMTVFEGRLIAAGAFRQAGTASVRYVAAWDGTSWVPMGASLNFPAYALAVHNGQLYVGGGFDNPASGIARWNGTDWVPLPGGDMDEGVYALVSWNGSLYAGGKFDTAGGVSARRIARYDGAQWHPLSTGMDGSPFFPEVYALTVHQSELIAAGPFLTAGGVTVNNVAAWDGSSWRALGAGVNIGTRAVLSYDGDLILGGAFTEADGQPALSIARWDGSAWHAMGSGFDARVTALAEYNGILYAGGWFQNSGASPVSRVASWDGSSWNPLGSGVDDDVQALCVYGTQLFLGGAFQVAGAGPSLFVAAWTELPPIAVTLARFAAVREAGGAVVRWEVAEAYDHLGFFLYRAEPGARPAERQRVRPELIAGSRDYEVVDPEAPSGSVEYWLEEVARSGARTWHGPALLSPAGAGRPPVGVAFATPNPFRAGTTIGLSLERPGPVRVRVFDGGGRLLQTLLEGTLDAGAHELQWDGSSPGGVAPAGTYFIVVESPEGRTSRKVIRTP